MPPNVLSNPWLWLLGLLITSGFLQYLVGAARDFLKKRAEAPKPASQEEKFVDQSLLVMSKSNAQLEDDNERLRQANRELSDMLSTERTERQAERQQHLREIQALETKLREMSSEIANLLRQVGDLRQRHNTDPQGLRAVGGGFSRTPPVTNDPYHPMDHSQGPGDRAEKTTEIRED